MSQTWFRVIYSRIVFRGGFFCKFDEPGIKSFSLHLFRLPGKSEISYKLELDLTKSVRYVLI